MLDLALVVACCLALAVAIIVLVGLPQRILGRVNEALSSRLEGVDRAQERVERALREELAKNREEHSTASRLLREELRAGQHNAAGQLMNTVAVFGQRLDALTQSLEQRMVGMQANVDEHLRALREDQGRGLDQSRAESNEAAKALRGEVAESVKALSTAVELRLLAIQAALDEGLRGLRQEQAIRLDQSRAELLKASERLRDEVSATLKQVTDASSALRTEVGTSVKLLGEMLHQGAAESALALKVRLDDFATSLNRLTTSNEAKLDQSRTELAEASVQLRGDLTAAVGAFGKSVEERLETVKVAVEGRLKALQEDNERRLEQMRQTVDEKLQGTLEKRLGDSFKLVGERLEAVQRGLGEMQTLASGVGDLKKVLTNVKVRGTWGEIQLGNLLSQMLTPEQYGTNVATRPGSSERVEFAVKLPGQAGSEGPVWLPIDAKFPTEDYQRLVDASERGDPAAVEVSAAQLEGRIRLCAKDIHDKYVNPPNTTDFGILYLPTEGLYAEVARRAGLIEFLQREYKVSLAGPTTLSALLNSLQMGFRSLAIQKRSSEVWQLLGAVKTEFGKFGDVIQKVDKKLIEASNSLQTVSVRTRAIERKLRGVEVLPAGEAAHLLGPSEAAADDGESVEPLA